jgi:hypothetical protein
VIPSDTAATTGSCGTCQFWRPAATHADASDALAVPSGRGRQGWGQCRRMPPTLPVVRDDKLMLVGLWPHTEEGDWCGEWQPAGG